MKWLFLSVILMSFLSCSSSQKSRDISSLNPDITGTFLAVSKYKLGRKGPNRAATRFYFHPIEGEKGSYHAILLEYINLIKMGPQFIASAKFPALNKAIGYLKQITRKISVYKVIPTQEVGTLEMWPMKVEGSEIVANRDSIPRKLILNLSDSIQDPLQGATIRSVQKGQPKEIFFPMKRDNRINGVQYSLANFIYSKFKLDSTWRKGFLPGPYLSAYARMNDEVLRLTQSGENYFADFKINSQMSRLSRKKRKKMFTNPKSAFLEGKFSVSEPKDGLFLFTPNNSDSSTSTEVKSRIGVFIDIFDATKSLNMDVVELVLISPDDPEDFLMYYEHPNNGEGEMPPK